MTPPRTPGIRTKIVATLGPASSDPAVLRRLIAAGVSVFRLNFSHGSLEEHGAVLENLRQVSADLNEPVAALGDLCGPKIRVDPIAGDEQRGAIIIETGQTLIIQRQTADGTGGRVSCNYPRIVDEVEVGQRVLIDDGQVRFVVTSKNSDELVCQCTAGGEISSRKGINLPDTNLSLETLTDHDLRCAEWAVAHDLDYVALSFVRSADDLRELRALTGADESSPHLIAKIERPHALKEIDQIIEAADGLMIARGDLGVEMDLARVPIIQKDLIRRCGAAGKPAIVATQMLQSMIDSATPSRAEVSDVANAIYDGADAVMLSGETSIGKHPVLVASTMAHIAAVTEEYLLEAEATDQPPVPPVQSREQDAALARGAWKIVRHLDAPIVAVWSQSGSMARILSKLRLGTNVIAVSSDPRTVRRMSLYYGVRPLEMDVPQSITALAPLIDTLLIEHGWGTPGQTMVIIGGTTLGEPGKSNAIMIHRIGAGG